MSETICLHCGATTHNGLFLCELCRYKTSDLLASLPVHFRNLARWKPGRAGSRSVPGSRVLYDGEVRDESPDRITRALDETGNEITTWARSLADDRGIQTPDAETEVDAIIATCGWLASHLVSIGTLEWAGEFVKEMSRAERRLSALTLTVVPGWYAGSCHRKIAMQTEDDDGLCGTPTFVVPGLTWVTCGACGSTTYARDHLDTIIAEAGDWVARPMRLAEAIVCLVDTELSVPRLHKRISKWGERKQLEVLRNDEQAPKQYRFGEVLDLLLSEGATRLEIEVDIAATG